MKHKLRQCQCCHSWLQFNQITLAHPLLGDQMTNIYRNPQIVSIQECTVTSSLSIKRLTKWTGENFADVTTSITNKKVIKINKESHICLIQYKLIEAKKLNQLPRGLKPNNLLPPQPHLPHSSNNYHYLSSLLSTPTAREKQFIISTQLSWHVKHKTFEGLNYLSGLTFNPIVL